MYIDRFKEAKGGYVIVVSTRRYTKCVLCLFNGHTFIISGESDELNIAKLLDSIYNKNLTIQQYVGSNRLPFWFPESAYS